LELEDRLVAAFNALLDKKLGPFKSGKNKRWTREAVEKVFENTRLFKFYSSSGSFGSLFKEK
jgi:hypothetical protein